jgi:DNA polymerase-3 subunit alpha
VFEALIQAGALDALGGHRAQFFGALDQVLREASLKQEEIASGQVSMFGSIMSDNGQTHQPLVLPPVATWTESERLTKEKETLGFYISGHPLEPFRVECELFSTHKAADLKGWVADPMTLAVVVTGIRRQMSKRSGSEFARLTVEDFSGSAEVMVFPEKWSVLSDQVKTDVPILLKGGYLRRDETSDNATFVVESITRMAELRASGQVMISIQLTRDPTRDPEIMRDVRSIAESFPGTAPLELTYSDGNGLRARLRSRTLTLAVNNTALNDLRSLLGSDAVRLQRGSK